MILKKTQLMSKLRRKSKRANKSPLNLSAYSRKKRQQILQAAIETFLDFGYQGTSMNLVAARAGVIKQTIYSHFQDKETLFLNVVSSLTVDQAQNIFSPESIEGRDPEDILRSFGEFLQLRTSDKSYAKLLRTIVGESGRFPKVAQLFTTATIKPGIGLLTNYLSSHRDIRLPDPEAFARIFIGSLIHQSMQQNLLYGKKLLPFESSRLIDELIRIFRHGSALRNS